MAQPWLRFHTPLIEPDMQISRIRLSDKTSRLRPRHVVPKPGQAHESEVPVEVREWIAPAPPDFVLEAQPPAQPHGCVSVERPIRLVRRSLLGSSSPTRAACGSLCSPALWSLAMFPIGRSARGLSRPRAECFSLTAGSRYGPRRSSLKTFARTCIPGNRTRPPALCRCASSPRSPSASASHDLPQSLQGRFGLAPSAQDHEVVGVGHEPRALKPEHLPSQHEPAHVNIRQQG